MILCDYSTMPMYRNVRLDLFVCRLNDCCPANGLTDADYKMFDAVFFAYLGNNQGFFLFFPRCDVSQVFKIESLEYIFYDDLNISRKPLVLQSKLV